MMNSGELRRRVAMQIDGNAILYIDTKPPSWPKKQDVYPSKDDGKFYAGERNRACIRKMPTLASLQRPLQRTDLTCP